jgi:uncharacterized iron-regulated membrane protein
LLFWLHLTAGTIAGLVILVLSLTGVLLAYERQIVASVDSPGLSTPPSPQTPPLAIGALLERVAKARPGIVPSMVSVAVDRTAPVTVSVGREDTLYVDAYTGTVLGEGSRGVRGFFHAVEDWHRWLATEGPIRTTGRAVTGAANLAFLFLVLSGVVLWWPRKGTWRHVRTVTLFQGGLAGRARDFNWHNVAGFWSAVPLALIVATGVVMSYPWANDLLYRLAGSEPPPPRGPSGPGGPAREAASRSTFVSPAGLDAARDAAAAQVPDWRTLVIRLPSSPASPLAVTIDRSSGAARPDLRSSLTLDAATGAVLRHETYASQSLGRRLRTWARWTHTGEAGGLVGQTLAALASAGGVLLVWTGLALAWRRFRAWRFGRSAVPNSDSRKPANPLEVTS